MANAVETLSNLGRRLTIVVPVAEVKEEVEKRLKIRARTVKAPGFRPGKVPMKMVAAQYGYEVESEVMNDKIGRAFVEVANQNNLRVAGYPSIAPKEVEGVEEGMIAFDATFEVYPDVVIGDISGLTVKKFVVTVSDAEVEKTIDVLRNQRAHYHISGEQSAHGDGADLAAKNGDRVTIDFTGRIDGVEFAGGVATDYPFVLGQGRMLPEFESAVLGLKVGEERVFPLTFPADYHGKDVAGKTAEFTIKLNKLEWAHLPEVDAEFAKSLGIADGDVQKLRDDIRANLEREVAARLKSKNKEVVMDALLDKVDFEVPNALIKVEADHLADLMRKNMQERGMNVKDMPLPAEVFNEQAKRRVRLGLTLVEMVKANNLQATAEQVKAQVADFAKSYEDPEQVIKYYFSDQARIEGVQSMVAEDNVVNFIYGQVTVTEEQVSFDEIMAGQQQG